MTTPTSAIGLAAVQTEFGGANPISLSEYYRGGSLVAAGVAAGTSGTQIATSGAIRLGDFRGVAAAAAVNPLPLLSLADVEFGGPATVSFTYTTDGTVAIAGSGSTQLGTQWYDPITAGIGAGHWVKVTITAGLNPTTNPGTGAWLALSSPRTWVWTRATVGTISATFTLSVSTDGTDGGIVATRTGNTASAEMA